MWMYHLVNAKNDMVNNSDFLSTEKKKEGGYPGEEEPTELELEQAEEITNDVLTTAFPNTGFDNFREFYVTLGVIKGKILHDMAKRRKEIYDGLTDENQELKNKKADYLITVTKNKEGYMFEAQNSLLRDMLSKTEKTAAGEAGFEYAQILNNGFEEECRDILGNKGKLAVEHFFEILEIDETDQNIFLKKYGCRKTDNLYSVLLKNQISKREDDKAYRALKTDKERNNYLDKFVRSEMMSIYPDYKKKQWINQGKKIYRSTRPEDEYTEIEEGQKIEDIIMSEDRFKSLKKELADNGRIANPEAKTADEALESIHEIRDEKKEEFFINDLRELETGLYSGKTFGMTRTLREPIDNLDHKEDYKKVESTYNSQASAADKYWLGFCYNMKGRYLYSGSQISKDIVERKKLGFHESGNFTDTDRTNEDTINAGVAEALSNQLTFASLEKTIKMMGKMRAKVKVIQGKNFEQLYRGFEGDPKQKEKAIELFRQADMFAAFETVDAYQQNILLMIDNKMKDVVSRSLKITENITYGEVFQQLGRDAEEAEKALEIYRTIQPGAGLDKKIKDVDNLGNDSGDVLLSNLKETILRGLTALWLVEGEKEASERMNDKERAYYSSGNELKERGEQEYHPEGIEEWANGPGKEIAKKVLKAHTVNELGRYKAIITSERSMGVAGDEKSADGLFREYLTEKSTYISDVIKHPEQSEEIIKTMLRKPSWYKILTRSNRKAEKNYDTYEQYHRTDKCFSDREKMIDSLSKVMAAQVSKAQKMPFNLKNVRLMATQIREICVLDRMKDEVILEALRDADAAKRLMHTIRDSLYKVPQENLKSLCTAMKRLHDNMVNDDGHSREYQKLSDNIKKLAEIEETTAGMTPDKRDKAIMKTVVNLVQSASKYMEGKEKVRGTTEGKACFNNALDAISELTKHIPDFRTRANVIIDRINDIRAKQKINKEDFTEKYGSQHVRLEERANKNVERRNSVRRSPAK